MNEFLKNWLEAVDKKNSVLCAGLDPADFEMGRGGKGLPEGINKRDWAIKYVTAVAPFCAAIKPNFQYWKDEGDVKTLKEIYDLAKMEGLVVIDDSKLADIGSTNDAGIFYAAQRADAVTIAPYAGNMEEAKKMAEKRDIGAITMCIMSNPEYEREKAKLVPVDESGYHRPDIKMVDGKPYVHRYIQLAHDAHQYGIDGIVIGAPSAKNHIEEKEISKVRSYVGDDMLVLLPGVGAQGGEADAIWKEFDRKNVIVNVGRSLMFPNGSDSTSEEQAKTAKQYQEMLNKLRAV